MENDDVLKEMVEMQKDVERFGLENEQDFHSIILRFLFMDFRAKNHHP